MERSLTICHFYPDLMNLYGDFGNILALIERGRRHGIEMRYRRVRIGEVFDPREGDLFFIGGGQDREQSALFRDALARREQFLEICESRKPLLLICGGYQMLGRRFVTGEGKEIPGLGILPMETLAGKGRLIGDTVYRADFLKDKGEEATFLYGFENHSGRSYLEEGAEALAEVIQGYGNNDSRRGEGCRFGTIFGTYSHGSFLPKNPAMADYLLELARTAKYGETAPLPYLLSSAEKIARASFRRRFEEAKDKGETV